MSPASERLVVRVAKPDEWKAAGELAYDAYRAGGHQGAGSAEYLDAVRDAAGRADSGILLVAVRGEGLVGTVTMCPPDSPEAELCRANEVEFRYLAVAPKAWGSGVATALVHGVVDRARRAGAHRLVCCVIDWNMQAHRLYVGHGFSRAPSRDWKPNSEVDLLAYELDLTSQADRRSPGG